MILDTPDITFLIKYLYEYNRPFSGETMKNLPKYLFLSLIILCLFISTAYSWPIPDSGQTKCYDNEKEISCPKPGEPFYGQDGNYNINPPSYTKLDENGNELPDDATSWVMVRDNVTGLIWEIKTSKDDTQDYSNPHDADNTYTWYNTNPEINFGYTGTAGDGTDTEDFINALNDEVFGGYTDWRLPDMYELASIVDLSVYDSAIQNKMFPNIKSARYWSSTSRPLSVNNGAHFLVFDHGWSQTDKKNFSHYVRAVRRGKTVSSNHLVINDQQTITDIATGLMWSQQNIHNLSWSDALTYCENKHM
jgi:hypothetical protein